MSLIASDGFEYADLAFWLIGDPADNLRNGNLAIFLDRASRAAGGWTIPRATAYAKGFDSVCPDGCPPSFDRNTFARAHDTGLLGAARAGHPDYAFLLTRAHHEEHVV